MTEPRRSYWPAFFQRTRKQRPAQRRERRNRFLRPRPEALEDRRMLAITTPVLAAGSNSIVFNGDGAADAINFSATAAGLLQHDLGAPFASSTDLDAATAGVQSRLVADITELTFTDPAMNDSVTFAGPHALVFAAAELSVAAAAIDIRTVMQTGGAGTVDLTAGHTLRLSNGGALHTDLGDITLGALATTVGNYSGVVLDNGHLQSASGQISLTGHGGGLLSNNHGIVLTNGSTITSTGPGGGISLVGTGGNADGDNVGVELRGAGTVITAASSPIDVVGQGGDGSGNLNLGVRIDDGAAVTSTGTATITINATGGDGASFNHGLFLANGGQISTDQGDVVLTGTGGQGTASFNAGVHVSSGASLTSTGSGSLDVVGQGGQSSISSFGIYLEAAQLLATDGLLTVRGTGGSGPNGNNGVVTTDDTLIQSTGLADIAITGVTGSGEGGSGFSMDHGADLAAAGSGSITIDGDGAAATNNTRGVRINGAGTTIVTSSGNITLGGQGGDGGDDNLGIEVNNGADISATSTGGVRLMGTGGIGVGGNHGVQVAGANTRVAAQDGALVVDGIAGSNGSGNFNVGVLVSSGAEIRSVGTATVDLSGSGGGGGQFNHGVAIQDAATQVSSAAGDITILGTGSGAGDSRGVSIIGEAVVTSTGIGPTAAHLLISGTSGAAAGANVGVRIADSGTRVESIDGDLVVIGTMSAGTGTGVELSAAAQIVASGTAPLELQGSGSNADGVRIASTVVSGNGTVDVHSPGTVALTAAGTITSTSGPVAVTSTTVAGQIRMADQAVIDAGSGSASLDAQGDVVLASVRSTGDVDVRTAQGQIVDGGDTDIDIRASSATLRARQGIGSAGPLDTDVATLSFENTVSGNVQFDNDGALAIGDAGGLTSSTNHGAGNILLCGASVDVTHTLDAATGTVRLNAGAGNVSQAAAAILATALGVTSAGNVELVHAGNNVETFAAGAAGSVVFHDADGFTVGLVTAADCFAGARGIVAGTDTALATAAGPLTISQPLEVAGTVRLTSAGNINQTSAGPIVAENLGVRAAGTIGLQTALSRLSGTFAAASTNAGDVAFANRGDYTVGVVGTLDGFPATTGVTTSSGSVDLNAQGGTITVDAIVEAGDGGNVRITADGGIPVVNIYDLNGSFIDTLGNGEDMTSTGGSLGPTGLTFGLNEGPTVANVFTQFPDNYSIEMLFSIDNTVGFKKLIDFKGLENSSVGDKGLYNRSSSGGVHGLVTLHNLGEFNLQVFTPGMLHHLVLTRDGDSGLVNVFVDGILRLVNLDDSVTQYTTFSTPNHVAHFFQDDLRGNSQFEASPGFVDYIRIYDDPLSAAEVSQLFNGTAAPVNGDGALDIRADVRTTNGHGDIHLAAETTIHLGTSSQPVTVSAAGSGDVVVQAGTNDQGGAQTDGEADGRFVMSDGSVVASQDGDITIQAPDDIWLSRVDADSDGDGAAGQVIVTADYGGPQASLSDGAGSIRDNLTGEDPNLRGAVIGLRAGAGIGTASDDLDTASPVGTSTAFAAATTSGGIHLDHLGGLLVGTVNLLDGVTITNDDGVTSTSDHIEIRSSGTLNVNQPVANRDGGDVTLIAAGAGADLGLNADVSAIGGDGNITLHADDQISQTNGGVNTEGGGQIALVAAIGTATGGITQSDGTRVASQAGTISLDAHGDIRLSSAATAAGVHITSTGGAIHDAGDSTSPNITAATATLQARLGIGAAADPLGRLETVTAPGAASLTVAAFTEHGDVGLHNVGGLTVGSLGTLVGVEIADPTDANPGGSIWLTAASPLTINSPVVNHGGGSITVAAEGGTAGGTAADDLDVNADVTASGGNGNIWLFAADAIDFDPVADITAAGTGDILASASTDFHGGSPQNGYLPAAAGDGDVVMNETPSGSEQASIVSAAGSVTLRGAGDVLVTEIAAPHVMVVADFPGVAGGMHDEEGAIIDNLSGEGTNDVNIRADHTALAAGSGIGADTHDDLDLAPATSIHTVAAETERGDIVLTNHGPTRIGSVSDPTGILSDLLGVTIHDATATGVGAAGPDSTFDNLKVVSGETLIIEQAVANFDGGQIILAADGMGDLIINADVTADGGAGNLSLSASGDVRFDDSPAATIDPVVSVAGSGDVQVRAGTTFNDGGLPVNGLATGRIVMGDGSTLQSDDGNLRLRAPSDIYLSRVNADADGTAPAGQVVVGADDDGVQGGLANGRGAIIDNLSGEGPANLNVTGATAVFTAAEGIGSDDDLDTDLGDAADPTRANLAARNTMSGNLAIDDGGAQATELTVGTLPAGTGPVVGLVNTAPHGSVHLSNLGPLTLDDHVLADGPITLTARDTPDPSQDVLTVGRTTTAGTTLDVTSRTGDITLNAGDHVRVAGNLTAVGQLIGTDTVSGETVAIDPRTGAVTPLGLTGTTRIAALAPDATTGQVYGADRVAAGNGDLYSLAPATGAGTFAADLSPGTFDDLTALADSNVADLLYGFEDDADRLVSVHRLTGAVTSIGPITVAGSGAPITSIAGMAFAPATNQLLAIDNGTRQLLTIDPASGTATIVGSTGRDLGGLAFDQVSQRLYATDNANDRLVVVSPVSGTVREVGDYLGDYQIDGLASRGLSARVTINIDNGDVAGGDADPGTPGAGQLTNGGSVTIDTVVADSTGIVSTLEGTFIRGGDDNDTFDLAPLATTAYFIDGNLPVFADGSPPVPPGDQLTLQFDEITAAPTLTVGVPGAGRFTFSSGSDAGTSDHEQPVVYESIERLGELGPPGLHLVLDSGGTGPSPDSYGNDGLDDEIEIRLNDGVAGQDGGTPGTDLIIERTGGAGTGPFLQPIYRGVADDVISLTVIGSNDDDTLIINAENGLPEFGGTVPAAERRVANTLKELWYTDFFGDDELDLDIDENVGGNGSFLSRQTGTSTYLDGPLSDRFNAASFTGSEYFGAVWLGQLEIGQAGSGAPLEAGDVTFGLQSIDGSTLYIDTNHSGVFDATDFRIANYGDRDTAGAAITGTVNLPAGAYNIGIAYAQERIGGPAIEARFGQGSTATLDYADLQVIDPTASSQQGLWFSPVLDNRHLAEVPNVFFLAAGGTDSLRYRFDQASQGTTTDLAYAVGDGDGGGDNREGGFAEGEIRTQASGGTPLTLYFTGLEPISAGGDAGGTLTLLGDDDHNTITVVDSPVIDHTRIEVAANSIRAATDRGTIDNFTNGVGTYEPFDFEQGTFGALQIYGMRGQDTLDLAALDPLETSLQSIDLDGDADDNDDSGADTLRVRHTGNLPATSTLTLRGGGGNDHFLLAETTRLTDAIRVPVVVAPPGPNAARVAAPAVETASGWNELDAIGEFGEPRNATIGQTFVAPAGVTQLDAFTFFLNDRMNSDAVEFEAFLMEWDGSRATGPVLFQSANLTTTNNRGRGGMEEFGIPTGGVPVTPGTSYIAFLSVSNLFDGEPGSASLGAVTGGAFAAGEIQFQNNGADFSLLTTADWTPLAGDLAFELYFDGGQLGGDEYSDHDRLAVNDPPAHGDHTNQVSGDRLVIDNSSSLAAAAALNLTSSNVLDAVTGHGAANDVTFANIDELTIYRPATDDTIHVDYRGSAPADLDRVTINGSGGDDLFVIESNTPLVENPGIHRRDTSGDGAFFVQLNGDGDRHFDGDLLDLHVDDDRIPAFDNGAGSPAMQGRDTFQYAGDFTLSGRIDGGPQADTLDYTSYGAPRTIQLLDVGSLDGFRGNDVSAAPPFGLPSTDSIVNSDGTAERNFINIDQILGTPIVGDRLIGPDLCSHWDVGDRHTTAAADDEGVIVSGDLNLGRCGRDPLLLPVPPDNAITQGRPTSPLPIAAPINAPERGHLLFDGFQHLQGGSLEDRFDFRWDGVGAFSRITGTIDGGGGEDTIDLRDFGPGSQVVVDLLTVPPGPAPPLNATLQGTVTSNGLPVVLGHLVAGRGSDIDSSIEHAFAGSGDDTLIGDNDDNTLGDGPGSDFLYGDDGNDTYRLEPGAADDGTGDSQDVVSEANDGTGNPANPHRETDGSGRDTVDFRFADAGVMFDADLIDGDDDATTWEPRQDVLGAFTGSLENAADPGDPANTDRQYVTLRRVPENRIHVGRPGRPSQFPSPYENIVGSQFDDVLHIDPLAAGGDYRYNGVESPFMPPFPGAPPFDPNAQVVRQVDANAGTDVLHFDALGQPLFDTGSSLTANGVGSIAYFRLELPNGLNDAPRIIDNGDSPFVETPSTASANISPLEHWIPVTSNGFGGDYLYHEGQGSLGPHTTTWRFEGVTPGKYRVAVTYPSAPAHPVIDALANDAPYTIYDDDFLLTTRDVDQRLPANDFFEAGVAWEELGVFRIESNTLVVQMSDLANGQVMADAVRIERISEAADQNILSPQVTTAGPELTVTAGPNYVTDGVSEVTLSTTIGQPSSRTFVITNDGDATLEIYGIDLAPAGAANLTLTLPTQPSFFSPPAGPGPLRLLPGEVYSFNVRLDALADPLPADPTRDGHGDFFGEIRIFSNDVDENVAVLPGAGVNPQTGTDPDPNADVDPFTFGVRGVVSNRTIVDDRDEAFTLVGGNWQANQSAGYAGGARWTSAEASGNRAIWTFSDLPDGTYRVSTTYSPAPDASTATPFKVSNINGELAAATLNQRLSPTAQGRTSLTEKGVSWVDLGGPYAVTGGSLVVELLGTASQPGAFLIADAVRIERLFSSDPAIGHATAFPDISVTDGTVALQDKGDYDFGETEAGTPLTKRLTIRNDGGADLVVREPISLPAGFSLLDFTAPTDPGTLGNVILPSGDGEFRLAPGETMTVRLRLDAAIPGWLAGNVSIPTGTRAPAAPSAFDPDEPTFEFSVSGRVADARIIDNQDPFGFAATPNFALTGDGLSNEQGFGRAVHFAEGNSLPPDTATWTFPGLTAGGRYRVSATWSPFANRATDAPFTVAGVDGGDQTILVNQQAAPDDLNVNGTQFEDLGVFTVTAGGQLTVKLTDAGANGQVIADAVRIERIVHPEAVVELSGVALLDGNNRVDFGSSDEPTSHTLTIRNIGDRPLTVGVPAMPAGYENLMADAFPRIVPAGDAFAMTVRLTGAPGAYDGTLRIPLDELAESTFEVRLVGQRRRDTDGDAARRAWIIDNEDPATATRSYSQIGFANYAGQGRDGSDADQIGSVDGSFVSNPSDAATFTFADLPAGLYRVSATWTAIAQNRASDAPYSIFDGGEHLRTVTVNQRLAPSEFFDDGSPWDDLDVVRIRSGTLTVQLANGSDGDVVADAIRIEPLDRAEIEIIDLGADLASGGDDDKTLVSNQDVVDFGSVEAGAAVGLTRVLRVKNHGNRTLDLGRLRLPLDFQLVGSAPTQLPAATGTAPSSFVDLEIAFVPPRVDTFFGELRLVPDDTDTDDDDSDESPFRVNLRATALPQVLIIDNDNVGYSEVGLSDHSGQGFASADDGLRDVDEGEPGGPAQSATWTFSAADGFTLQPDTTYRVSATWTAFSNRATDAPLTIGGDMVGAPVTITYDQRQVPNDFSAAGADWEDLAIIRTDGSSQPTITLTLTDEANGNVIADAMRLEVLPNHGPEILVTGSPNIADGGSYDIGTAFLNSSLQHTFHVHNMGTAPLILDGGGLAASLEAIPGFELVSSFTPAATAADPLLPGATSTFTVQLNGAALGEYSGIVNFDTNDADEGPFNFVLSGTVAPATLILDNDGPAPANTNYHDSGNLLRWTQGHANDVREAPAGGVVETATYTFENLVPGEMFQVSATWTAFVNRATDAPYRITGITAGPQTVYVNQRLAPGDFQVDGTSWEDLGTFTIDPSGTLTVTLSGSSTGNVIADAIRIHRRTDPEIEVRRGGAVVTSGTELDYGTALAGSSSSQVFTIANVGAGPLQLGDVLTLPAGFTLGAVSQPAGQPDLFDHLAAPPIANTTILAPGETASFEIVLSTASAGVYGGTASFGNNDADEGPFNFSIQGEVADALMIDNDDPLGYADTGNMTLWGQGFQGDVREAVGGGTPQGATFRFSGLPAGNYRVSATWTPYSNRASNAAYVLNGGPVEINQRMSPSNPASTPAGTTLLDAGTWFADLDSSFAFDGSGDLVVDVSDDGANGNVIIDAIRVERLSPLQVDSRDASPAGQTAPLAVEPLRVEQLPPLMQEAIGFWTSRDATAADRLQGVEIIIKDLPPAILGLGSSVTPTIWLDEHAAGYGWAIPAPATTSPSSLGISPLAVITHELGHVLGLEDLDPETHAGHVMAARLPVHRDRLLDASPWAARSAAPLSWVAYQSTADHVLERTSLHHRSVVGQDRLPAGAAFDSAMTSASTSQFRLSKGARIGTGEPKWDARADGLTAARDTERRRRDDERDAFFASLGRGDSSAETELDETIE